jgi:hypothetical protein
LGEGAAASVGGLERGIAQRGAQAGMVTVAQPRFEGLESSSLSLVSFVGDPMEGRGDGGVAVCGGGQGEAQQCSLNIRPDTGDPGRVQAVEEVAAGSTGSASRRSAKPRFCRRPTDRFW